MIALELDDEVGKAGKAEETKKLLTRSLLKEISIHECSLALFKLGLFSKECCDLIQ